MSKAPIVIQRSFEADYGAEKRCQHRLTGLATLETAGILFSVHLAATVTRADIMSPADLK
jgi:hypothetical protein